MTRELEKHVRQGRTTEADRIQASSRKRLDQARDQRVSFPPFNLDPPFHQDAGELKSIAEYPPDFFRRFRLDCYYVAAHPRGERLRRVKSHQPASIEDGKAIALLRLFRSVGGQKDSQSADSAQRLYVGPELAEGSFVKALRRLVHQKYLRLVH